MNFQITGSTNVLCVIGDPIAHSMSPKMHNAAIQDLGIDYVYTAFHVSNQRLEKAVEGFRALQIKGINVTIPHKVEIMQYLDEIEPTAAKLGAINTILNEDGVLKAKNTDGEGAIKSLKDNGCNPAGKKAVILGAGGASRALAYYLARDVESLTLFDLDLEMAEKLAQSVRNHYDIPINAVKMELNAAKAAIEDCELLINATPVGMHPKIDQTPIPIDFLHTDLTVFDIVYNPIETKLLQDAKNIGCTAISGVDMFVNQGYIAFEWWTNKTPNRDLMREIVVSNLKK